MKRSAWPAFIAFLVLLPSWLGLAGHWHWALDLFAHFRWQYLVAAFFVVAWALWRSRRVVLVLALATTLLNGWLIAALAWQPQLRTVTADGDFLLRALSLNVLTSNPRRDEVIAHVRDSGADVVVLTEVDHEWAAALEALAAQYPHRLVHPRPDHFGLALLSRVPLESPQVLQDDPVQRPSVVARIRHQGRSLLVIGTHPPPPLGMRLAEMRDRQLRALHALVEQHSGPVIVLGDFNATPWSAPMRELTAGRLGYRKPGAALGAHMAGAHAVRDSDRSRPVHGAAGDHAARGRAGCGVGSPVRAGGDALADQAALSRRRG